MGFLDLIKKGVVEEFTGTISTGELLLSLLTALISALIITFIYKKKGGSASLWAVVSFFGHLWYNIGNFMKEEKHGHTEGTV